MYNDLHSYQKSYTSPPTNYDISINTITRYEFNGLNYVYFDNIPELVRQYEENGKPLEDHDSYEEGEELEEYKMALENIRTNKYMVNYKLNSTKLFRMLQYGNATKAYEWAKELKNNNKYPYYINDEDANNPFPDLF